MLLDGIQSRSPQFGPKSFLVTCRDVKNLDEIFCRDFLRLSVHRWAFFFSHEQYTVRPHDKITYTAAIEQNIGIESTTTPTATIENIEETNYKITGSKKTESSSFSAAARFATSLILRANQTDEHTPVLLLLR